ncbi:MAG: endonuclease III [Planctomycetes bacterium]|nr:endonuclease III [Planctomycetota bacterium]
MDAKVKKKPATEVARAQKLLAALRRRYPDARCALHWNKPHELLIATILSAQSTDVGVNKATPALFARFPSPRAFADATPADIEPFVKTLNFFRNKARAIHESMKMVCERHRGEVPRTMEALLELRGVARKTANVVLGNAFGMNEGVVVDTHVGRLARRMKLSRHEDPVDVEADLMGLFPREHWCQLSHLLIDHGRNVCKKRGGSCSEDSICKEFCSEAKRATPLPSMAQDKKGPSRPRKPRSSKRASARPRRG